MSPLMVESVIPERLRDIGYRLLGPTGSTRLRSFRNFAWLAASDGFSKLVFFASGIVLARALHPTAYGTFVLAQSITYYFWYGVDLGTTMYGIRELATHRQLATKIASTLLTIRFAGALVFFAIYAGGALLWPMSQAQRLVCLGASIYLLAYALYPDFVAKGLERFHLLAIGSVTAGIAFLLFVILAVRTPAAAPLAAGAWSLSYGAGALALHLALQRETRLGFAFSTRLGEYARVLRSSLQFTLTGVLTFIYDTLPILFVALTFSGPQLGLFSAIYRLVVTVSSAAYLIPTAVYPILSDLYRSNRQKFRVLHRWLTAFMLGSGLCAVAAVAPLSHKITLILFGGNYEAAAPILLVFAFDVPMYMGRFSYGITLAAADRQLYYTVASLVGIIVLCALLLTIGRHNLPLVAGSVVVCDGVVAVILAAIFYTRIVRERS